MGPSSGSDNERGAKRAGLKEIILCRENAKHIEDIEPEYIAGVAFHYIDRMEQVPDFALGKLRVEVLADVSAN